MEENDLGILKDIAKSCFNVFGLSRWGRVDILQDQKGNFFVLELNTVPGMTDHSLFPYAASLQGFSFDELVLILEESHERIRYLVEFFLNMPFYKQYRLELNSV